MRFPSHFLFGGMSRNINYLAFAEGHHVMLFQVTNDSSSPSSESPTASSLSSESPSASSLSLCSPSLDPSAAAEPGACLLSDPSLSAPYSLVHVLTFEGLGYLVRSRPNLTLSNLSPCCSRAFLADFSKYVTIYWRPKKTSSSPQVLLHCGDKQILGAVLTNEEMVLLTATSLVRYSLKP